MLYKAGGWKPEGEKNKAQEHHTMSWKQTLGKQKMVGFQPKVNTSLSYKTKIH